MKPAAILYATREGHTERVAQQLVADLRRRGLETAAFDLREVQDAIDLSTYSAIVLAASVHAGQHEREMIDFVKRHLETLQSLPNAFLSVTLSEAGAERKDTTPEEHARFVADVRDMTDRFVADTGWQPEHVVPVAGALRYTQYNFFVRLIIKHIAKQPEGRRICRAITTTPIGLCSTILLACLPMK